MKASSAHQRPSGLGHLTKGPLMAVQHICCCRISVCFRLCWLARGLMALAHVGQAHKVICSLNNVFPEVLSFILKSLAVAKDSDLRRVDALDIFRPFKAIACSGHRKMKMNRYIIDHLGFLRVVVVITWNS